MKTGRIIETIENGNMKRVFSCCKVDCTQLTTWLIPNYCPHCGAKITELTKYWRDKNACK